MRKRIALVPILVASLLVALPGNAAAIESVPALQWPAPSISSRVETTLTHVSGVVTTSCEPTAGSNLKTYSLQGQVVRNLPQSQVVDGVPNCMPYPSVDKNGDLYGVRMGYVNDSLKVGSEVVAYRDSAVKWKHPINCGNRVVIPKAGADGNIYFVNGDKRLIGLSPQVESGTSQPKKVLDIPAAVSCEPAVPFRGGIAVTNGSWVYYYTYGGKYLGMQNGVSPNASSWINAEGRLFFPTYVGAGSSRGVKVSAYDPFKQEVSWTAPEASFGQTVDLLHMHPTPDGGVLAVVTRTKVAAGMPTDERTYALVKIGPTGLKAWDKDLPNRNADSTTTFINARVGIDAGGRIVVTRSASLRTTNGDWRHGVSMEVLNSSGTPLYQKMMHGNLDANSGEITGYQLAYGGDNRPALGSNTLFIHAAKCKDSGCSVPVEAKLYPIAIPGLGMDYPRSDILGGNIPARYVALGDSFSSGEGIAPFEEGTDKTGVNECHRSTKAYPRLIAGSSPRVPPLFLGSFRACSGAQTPHIHSQTQWNEGTQAGKYLSEATELVTVTIGGNDIGFGDFGKACILSRCEVGSEAYATTVSKIENLSTALELTYRAILSKAPRARIYVVGYPQVVAYKAVSDPFDLRCAYLYDGSTTWADAQATRDVVTKLNLQISKTVKKVHDEHFGNYRLGYIAADDTNSPFKSHEICSSSDSWFQNVDQGGINDFRYVFHPNTKGQEGYATVVSRAINS